MAYQIFISHTEKDVEFCDIFDRACARVGIRAFRSEFEKIETPAWETIKGAMNKSRALFLLVGKELVRAQESSDPNWRYTQNWIAYEIGLACQRGIDVWVVCDGMEINFPVPYLNNYLTISLRNKASFKYMVNCLKDYNKGKVFRFPGDYATSCPHENCGAEFNLHIKLHPRQTIKCPQCLRNIIYPGGFNL